MTRVYGWHRFYEQAILEPRSPRLTQLIRAAQAAIDARLQQLAADPHDTAEERQAIADALAELRVLEHESPNH
jgi:hypothetical protein